MKTLVLLAACCAVAAAATPPKTMLLPAGTPLRIQLETALSSGDNHAGDSFAGRVMETVYLHGYAAIPAGSIIEGRVGEVRDTRPAVGNSAILLRPDYISLPNGQHYIISAEVTDTNAASGVHVGSEGLIESSRKPDAEDARRATVAGASGLIAGVVLAGAKGAMVGSVMGGALAGGWWLFTHRHAALNPGAEMDIRLDRPILLQPQTALAESAARAQPIAPAHMTPAPIQAMRPALSAHASAAVGAAEPAPPPTPKPKVEDLTPHS